MLLRWFSIAMAAALGVFTILGACSTEESPETTSTGAGAGGQPSTRYGDDPCYQCRATTCAADKQACNADPSCAAFLSCVEDCDVGDDGLASPACEQACPSLQGSAGIDANAAYRACLQTAVDGCSACSGGVGGGSACGYSEPILCETCAPSNEADACDKCNREQCCTADDNLLGPGFQLLNCWANCPDYACESACYQTYPDQIVYLGSWIACHHVHCRAPESCAPLMNCGYCQATECPNEFARCYADAGCYQTVQCVGTCPDTACVTNCLGSATGGQAEFEALGACQTTRCLDACGGG